MSECSMNDVQAVNVVFLDIDGVLQPYGSREQFEHNLDDLRNELAEKYDDKAYLKMDKYDLGAAVYDWDQTSLSLLKQFLDENRCKIVVHSDWRLYQKKGGMERLLRLQGLDRYYIGDVGRWEKPEAIKRYLNAHPEVKKYVVVDDNDRLFRKFKGYVCITHNLLKQENVDKINRIFAEQATEPIPRVKS